MTLTRPPAHELEARLRQRIEDRTAVVGVLGLGYVGLPLALAFSRAGLKVIGFDVDAGKVQTLNSGHSYLGHIDTESVRIAVQQASLEATQDFDRLSDPDALVIAVPTPLTRQREPDTHFIVDSVEQIQRRLRPGQLVVLESTTYPGTTEELVLPILRRVAYKLGRTSSWRTHRSARIQAIRASTPPAFRRSWAASTRDPPLWRCACMVRRFNERCPSFQRAPPRPSS